ERRIFENVTLTGSNVASIEVQGFVTTGPLASQNVLTDPAVGSFFEDGAGPDHFTLIGTKFVFTGAASDATTAIRRLVFRPTPNCFSESTSLQFEIDLIDSS